MAGTLLSSSWYRVEGLKPRLRPHVCLYRHRYRGQVWFVMSDPASGRTHRFTPAARLILNGMNGSRSVGELWEIANRRLGERAPTQDELIGLLGQLHSADLMQCDVSPDVSELFMRSQRQERAKTRQSIGNPMSIKWPLIDPNRMLDRLRPFVAPLWNRWGGLMWLMVVAPAALLALRHGSELTSNVSDRILATNNLFMLLLLFPLIKVLHEMGHAIATKMRGGEVHEMGIMLLMFMPVPYVDASSATTFRSKRDRALVGAAGMLVEVFVAALAMYLWLLAEPGLLRSMAFNTMLVAGVSTLIFNGNPLLRYDAYYILADLIEIPNLSSRANRHIGSLVERHLFGVPLDEATHESPGERAWFLFYAPASFIYRTVVSITIILFVAGEFFVIGALLAIWAFVMSLVVPVFRLASHLISSPSLSRVRTRAYWTTAGVLSALLGFIALVPMPFRTQAEGIVWLPEQAIVRAGADGFMSRLLVEPGRLVHQGALLVESVDPTLEAQLRSSEAKVAELKARYDSLFVEDRVAAELDRDELNREQSNLDRLRERVNNLVVLSPGDGRFVLPQAVDMPGRFYRKGELIGYVTEKVRPVVRVVIQQGEVDIVRQATQRVELRQAHRIDEVVTGSIIREVPGGAVQLPSRALSMEGGGQIAVDPRDSKGLTSLKHTFQLDIDLPPDGISLYGGRVFVRFEHVKEPLGVQWYRRLRPVFLSHFHV
ncbi:MAG: hypothetical protein Q7U28_06350 [Aquabacterium sp.]|nr:hypothetical protein [Aquabacterium sp.]